MVPADSSICFGCRPPSQAAHAAQSFSEHSPLEVWGRKRADARERGGIRQAGGWKGEGWLSSFRNRGVFYGWPPRMRTQRRQPSMIWTLPSLKASHFMSRRGPTGRREGGGHRAKGGPVRTSSGLRGSPPGPDLMRAYHPRVVHIIIGLLVGWCGMSVGRVGEGGLGRELRRLATVGGRGLGRELRRSGDRPTPYRIKVS